MEREKQWEQEQWDLKQELGEEYYKTYDIMYNMEDKGAGGPKAKGRGGDRQEELLNDDEGRGAGAGRIAKDSPYYNEQEKSTKGRISLKEQEEEKEQTLG